MTIALSGSIAFDYLMTFPGRFKDHILSDRLNRLSLSFLVDSLERRRGVSPFDGNSRLPVIQFESAGTRLHPRPSTASRAGVNAGRCVL